MVRRLLPNSILGTRPTTRCHPEPARAFCERREGSASHRRCSARFPKRASAVKAPDFSPGSAAFQGGAFGAPPHNTRHSVRSDPAFSSARFLGTGSRREESLFVFFRSLLIVPGQTAFLFVRARFQPCRKSNDEDRLQPLRVRPPLQEVRAPACPL
jgi:hypothetical protein